jgi:hypothetical protein
VVELEGPVDFRQRGRASYGVTRRINLGLPDPRSPRFRIPRCPGGLYRGSIAWVRPGPVWASARVRFGPELFPGIRVPPGPARSHGMYMDARWSLLFNGNTGPCTVPVDASIRTYILGGGHMQRATTPLAPQIKIA